MSTKKRCRNVALHYHRNVLLPSNVFRLVTASAANDFNEGDMVAEDKGLAGHKEGEKKRSSATENAANKQARVGPPKGFLLDYK